MELPKQDVKQAQSQQSKHRTTSMTPLWCIHCKPKAHNTTCPSATTTDSEQANARINEMKHFEEQKQLT